MGVHEMGHLLAARLLGLPVTLVALGVGREIARWGRLSVRLWPLGIGVEIPDDAIARAEKWQRLITHGSGPAANLALAFLMLPLSWWGAVINAVLGAANLLPLPYQDGGWIASALLCRDFAHEQEWQRRMARPQWFLAGLAAAVVVAVAGCSAQARRLPGDVRVFRADGTEVQVSELSGKPLALFFYRHYG